MSTVISSASTASVPSAYAENYAKSRIEDHAAVDNYLAHTTTGDPELDPLMEELSSLPPGLLHRYIGAGIEQQDETLSRAPQSLRDFFANLEDPPWLDLEAFRPAIRAFHVNVDIMLVAFVTGVLVEGFSTLIAKSFKITGRVASTKRRLQQNNRHMMEIFFPAGMERSNDGWKLSTRIRFVHSRIRALLDKSDDWNQEAWGTPVSAAHLGFAISVFSRRLLEYSELLGANFTNEEKESVMCVWRYAGYLMGIPETLLYTNAKDAKETYEIGYLCEPSADPDSVAVANLLIRSIPEVAGTTDEAEVQKLVALAYKLSRALIGNRLADQFGFPQSSTVLTLWYFRLKQRLQRMTKHDLIRSNNFTQLLQISVYDSGGLSYKMPSHVYTSKSIEW